jgi:2-keto-3-deoxy-galactonokinase
VRQMRDFLCECGEITERLVDTQVKQIDCACGKQAKQLIGMPTVKLEGITGSFPGAHDKWARIREDNAKIKARRSFHGE